VNRDTLDELIVRGDSYEIRMDDPQKLADWVADVEAFLLSINKLTSKAKDYIKKIKIHGQMSSTNIYNLIAYLKQLSKSQELQPPTPTKRNQIFVAMWFGAEMDKFYEEGYEPAIQSMNYTAMRIDRKQFNDSIIEEIWKEIGNSIVLIADLTNNRGGVYFEAGIARGVKLCGGEISLIFTCRKDYFDNPDTKPHFDVQGNNILIYADVDDLKRKLETRIKETIRQAQGG